MTSRRRAASLFLFAALAGCGQGALAQGSAPAAGYARIWIYRLLQPYVTLATPYLRFDGRIVAISRPGEAFYRDVAPGQYQVTVDSSGTDVFQFAPVAVVAGQTVYVRVDADNWWAAINPNYQVDTFYTREMLPQVARAEMAGMPVYGGY